jgi:hypothetical protein
MKRCFICKKIIYDGQKYWQNGYGRITCDTMKCTLDPRQPKKLVEKWNAEHRKSST